MTLYKLIIRSIWHYRRQYLALFAGTLLSAAILTGAMITGDSVDYSLRKMVDLRLGNSAYALQTGDRFVSSDLAKKLSKKLCVKTSAVLQNQGMASNPAKGKRVNIIAVLGIDEDFINLSQLSFSQPKPGEAVISQNLAEKLELKTGDDLIVRMTTASLIPANAPFAEDDKQPESMRLKVVDIANSESLGRFSLQSNQVAPYNVFVSREYLAEKLGLPNYANLILSENIEGLDVDRVNQAFADVWTLEDAGLQILELEESDIRQLSSNRIFIEKVISDAVEELPFASQAELTYMVNSITHNKKSTPYSFVAATSIFNLSKNLNPNEIIINQWLADDLQVNTGDTLSLEYFTIGALRSLVVQSRDFVIREIIPLENSPALRAFMPDFPGMSNAGSCTDWSTGVPINLEKIRDKDEKYWDDFRGTPKAFISLDSGKKMWANSFGAYTAFRFFDSEHSSQELAQQIMSHLSPMDLGLQFDPVRELGMSAVSNAVDFGELFLSLSFFVIAAGVLLTVLLFSLHIASRNREGGILAALGFSRKQILHFRLSEAFLVITLGSIAGAFTGILYNHIIMTGLNGVWQDVVRTTVIWVHVKPATLIIGALSGIVIAFVSIIFITRTKMKQPLNALHGLTSPKIKGPFRFAYLVNILTIVVGLGGALALVIFSLHNKEGQSPGTFLMAGGLFLLGMLALINRILLIQGNKNHSSPLSLWQLSQKNAARNKAASLSIIALLALGTFTIIISGANQKTFYGASNNAASGTGGYLFWVENAVAINYDLNTDEGKEKYGLEDEPVLDDVEFVQFHDLKGDDASCLNLNQVSQARILGVNARIFDEKGAFSFTKLWEGANETHPWLTLNQSSQNNLIPAFADQTVITWGLMKKVGDTLRYLNEQGKEIRLLLMGGLKSSVFQGNILIADSIFQANFPSSDGSVVMLIDAPEEKQDEVAALLEDRLVDYGLLLTSTRDRLMVFNSVTNTYLSVFMILGGLGVLIGTIGLGIVLLRNILDRKYELALLRALGFQKRDVLRLIILENLMLLVGGIVVGVFAALIGVLPSLLSDSFEMNTSFILFLLSGIFVSGLLWIYFPAKWSLSKYTSRDLQSE